MNAPLHILLIEDDPDDVDLLQAAFADCCINANFNVVMQGDKVLSHLITAEQLPDIIVLDLNLPKVQGKQILTAIKATDELKHLPVIILTTSSAQSDKDCSIAAGAIDYLIKPVTLEGYYEIVKRIVEVGLANQ